MKATKRLSFEEKVSGTVAVGGCQEVERALQIESRAEAKPRCRRSWHCGHTWYGSQEDGEQHVNRGGVSWQEKLPGSGQGPSACSGL